MILSLSLYAISEYCNIKTKWSKKQSIVDKNIIATIKMQNNFWYRYRNIGLFSLAPHLVIALPTLR